MTAENFPAQQMCCLLVNWSTDRFEYIFLNYYQCHKDWRRRRWTVRANTRQLMMKLMTKIKIDVDTAVHSVLKCFTPEKRRNATRNCTTAMRQKERCRSLLTTTMSILALSVVLTLPAKLMRWLLIMEKITSQDWTIHTVSYHIPIYSWEIYSPHGHLRWSCSCSTSSTRQVSAPLPALQPKVN